MAQEKLNPGIWIGAAIVVAALIVAMVIPGKVDERTRVGRTEEKARGDATGEGSSTKGDTAKSPNTAAVAPPRAGVEGTVPAGKATSGATVSAVPGTPAPLEPPATPVTREVVEAALDNVQFSLRDFRVALGGNPVGNNAEITSALLGNNPKQLALPQPDGSRVNGAGELCDPWGTPYFFHQQSGTLMEVRSAGPDRKMWTGDDVQM
jgi:hypothetical protein